MNDLHTFWYFDPSTRKAYKVIAIPQNNSFMMQVYDADRDPRASYYVIPGLLGRTEIEAIRLAKASIVKLQEENHAERDRLQREDDELTRLLSVCDDPSAG